MKKRIKRMMKNGLITLIVFSLFFGCSDPFSSELSPITFELDAGLYEDGNGFHHLMIDMDRWQTLHRLSGHVYRNGEPINIIKFGWSASHYWYIGDTLGYVIANHGLSDDLIYVAYDTTYLDWFSGFEVPVVNGASYSREDGEVNTMFAPVQSMKGDTVTVYFGYHDNWTYDDTYGEFYIVLD